MFDSSNFRRDANILLARDDGNNQSAAARDAGTHAAGAFGFCVSPDAIRFYWPANAGKDPAKGTAARGRLLY